MNILFKEKDEFQSMASVLDVWIKNGLFSSLGQGLVLATPSYNLVKGDQSYTIELAAPGCEKTDFDIELEKDILKIRATRPESHYDQTFFERREFTTTNFEKAFKLPFIPSNQDIVASYERGVLNVEIKTDKIDDSQKSKTISIQ